MKAYRGVDPLDFLAETGKGIIYIYIYISCALWNIDEDILGCSEVCLLII